MLGNIRVKKCKECPTAIRSGHPDHPDLAPDQLLCQNSLVVSLGNERRHFDDRPATKTCYYTPGPGRSGIIIGS